VCSCLFRQRLHRRAAHRLLSRPSAAHGPDRRIVASRDDSCTKVSATRIMGRMRLLPNDKDIGWVPYVWLAYLVALPINGYFWQLEPLQWMATFLSLGAFLVLYFQAYWVDGRDLLWIITLMAALGVALIPINPSAAVYLIYAGSFAGQLARPAMGARILGAL